MLTPAYGVGGIRFGLVLRRGFCVPSGASLRAQTHRQIPTYRGIVCRRKWPLRDVPSKWGKGILSLAAGTGKTERKEEREVSQRVGGGTEIKKQKADTRSSDYWRKQSQSQDSDPQSVMQQNNERKAMLNKAISNYIWRLLSIK